MYNKNTLKTYQIIQLKVGTSIINYCYIVIDIETRDCLIIDPSWDYERITSLFYREKLNFSKILLTHSHYDHVNLVESLVNEFDVPVYMSKNEIKYYNFECKNLIAVDDFDKIQLGKTEITCILTPGHTQGSLCFYLSHSIFTGDTVFIEGCGICNISGGNAADMFDSFQKIRKIIPLQTRVYPGHSFGEPPGQTFANLMEKNIYFHICDKATFIKFRMRRNQKKLFDFH